LGHIFQMGSSVTQRSVAESAALILGHFSADAAPRAKRAVSVCQNTDARAGHSEARY
jgi:hypothetical protein